MFYFCKNAINNIITSKISKNPIINTSINQIIAVEILSKIGVSVKIISIIILFL